MSEFNNIRKLRLKNDLTQLELAELLNVSKNAVSSWENGRSQPLLDKVTVMAELFKVRIEDVLGIEYTDDSKDIEVEEIIDVINDMDQEKKLDLLEKISEIIKEEEID